MPLPPVLLAAGKEPEDLVGALQPPSTTGSTISPSEDISVEPSAASLGGGAPCAPQPPLAPGGSGWPSGDLSREVSAGVSSFSPSRSVSATLAATAAVAARLKATTQQQPSQQQVDNTGGGVGLQGIQQQGSGPVPTLSLPMARVGVAGHVPNLNLSAAAAGGGSQQGCPVPTLNLSAAAGGGRGEGGSGSVLPGGMQSLNLSGLHQTLTAACPTAAPASLAAAGSAGAQGGENGAQDMQLGSSGQVSPWQDPACSDVSASDVSNDVASVTMVGIEGGCSEGDVGNQQQQGQGLLGAGAGDGSVSCDAATDRMAAQLSVLTVVENDDYSKDYDIVVRECLKQGLYPTAADSGRRDFCARLGAQLNGTVFHLSPLNVLILLGELLSGLTMV